MELPRTIIHQLHERASRFAHRPALWTKRAGTYLPTSWQEYGLRVRQAALGLIDLGHPADAPLAIMAGNREEWLVCDLAAMAVGGVPVGIYTTSSPEQVEYVLGHSEAVTVVVEHGRFLAMVEALRPRLPKLRNVIVMEESQLAGAREGLVSYRALLQRGATMNESAYFDRVNALKPESLATLIYTSGTTGNPKGVMLSHHNLTWTTRKLAELVEFDEGQEIAISYLPLSHIAEQLCSIHGPIMVGAQVYFAEALELLGHNLREVRPTAFFAVPRVWEKFKAKAEDGVRLLPTHRRALLGWARRVAIQRHRIELAGEPVPLALELQYQAARRVVFEKFKKKIGLDRTHIFVTSAAPISLEVLEFFASMDVVLRELYGQSEVTGPTSVSTSGGGTRLGRLGRPMPGIEVKIAEDTEICVRGQNVCMGYYKESAATAELIDRDGWLHSGDLGEIDATGFLRVTGRKKEILVTSGGKKTAPANIEGLLKELGPVGNAMVIGDNRNYLVALLPLDPEKVPAFAREHGFPESAEALAKHQPFLELLSQRLEKDVNPKLARFETIKKFAVLPQDFTVDTGELTPTLKLRRKVAEAKFASVIESLYAEGAPAKAG